MATQKLHFETLQLHVGQEHADPASDARAVPIYQTSSYVFHNSAHAAARFGLADPGNIYSRLTNTTQDILEQRIAALEGGVGALAVASGAAAITYSILNITRAGDHVVAAKTIYGGTYDLLQHTLVPYGISTTFVDPADLNNFEKAIRPETKLLFIETFGNPNGNVIDIEKVAAIAHKHQIPLVVDNTFATPFLLRPIELGADIVVHSATKFIGGHGTTIGGVIIDGGHFDYTSGKWPDLTGLTTTNRTCAVGEGIAMAVKAGGTVTDMDQIQLLYLGNCSDGQLTKYPPRDVNGTDQIIFVNKQGQRFVREDGRRDEICLAVMEQQDGMFYMLESADGDKYQDISDPSWRSADGFTFDYLVNNGYVFTADTLEGAASQAGIDPIELRKTVEAFNACAAGETEDPLGRKLYSTQLVNGPWVITPRRVSIHHTMGGIHIDELCHVLDENGAPVPGLYAAGEVTGGIHGSNRLGGNAVVETVVFGKLAAETILSGE